MDNHGEYSVSLTYKDIYNTIVEGHKDDTFSLMWKLKLPSKASCFVWRLLLDRLPMKYSSGRRNIDLSNNDTMCLFMFLQVKTSSHVFFTCLKVMDIWKDWYGGESIATVLPNDAKQHFWQHCMVGI